MVNEQSTTLVTAAENLNQEFKKRLVAELEKTEVDVYRKSRIQLYAKVRAIANFLINVIKESEKEEVKPELFF